MRTGPRRAIGIAWMVVAAGAQAAYLAVLEPGQWALGVRPLRLVLRQDLGPLLAMAVLAAAVAVGIFPVVRRLPRKVNPLALLAFLVIWAAAISLLARSPVGYAWSAGWTVLAHAVVLGALVLAVRALPAPRTGGLAWRNAIPWLAAGTAFLGATAVALIVFQRVPHVPDSVAYLFQARTYAAGLAYRPAPPEPALFTQFLIPIENGKWYSVFPPGWPLVLAPAAALGIPWIVNPILAALTVLAAHALVRRTVSRDVADLVAFLLALSPTFLFISGSLMSHTLSLLCAMTAFLGAERASGGRRWAALGGGALGLLFLTRPIEGAVVGLLLLLRAAGLGGPRLDWRAIAAAAIPAAAITALFFVNNAVLTGDPLVDPIQHYFDTTFYPGSNHLGFGPERGNLGWGNDLWPGHSPAEAALNLNVNLNLMDVELFGWGFGSLLGLVLFLMMGAPGRNTTRPAGRRDATASFRAYAMPWISLPALIAVSAALYWYSAADMGPRYLLQALIPVAVLSVVGALALAARLRVDRGSVTLIVVLATLLGAPQVITWRAANKYRDYRGMTDDVRRLAPSFGQDALVLIRSAEGRSSFADLGAGLVLTEVPLESGTVYAREGQDDEVARLRDRLGDRPLWIVEAPTRERGGFRIIQRPDTVPERVSPPPQ